MRDDDLFSYKKHVRKKVIKRLKIIFVVIFMGFLFLNVSTAHAAENTSTVKMVTYEELVKFMKLQKKNEHKKIESDAAFFENEKTDTSWILEAPGF